MGALDSNGVWTYTEADPSAPFSATLNLLATSASTEVGKLKSHPAGRWGLASAQSVTTGTFTLLAAATAYAGEVDAAKFTNSGGSVTVNEAGWYDVQAHAIHGSNATGRRITLITKNATLAAGGTVTGTAVIASVVQGANSGGETVTDLRARPVLLAAGDIIRAYVFQDSGSTLSMVVGAATTYYGETFLMLRKATP